ncbi:hypothetical protein TI39_contig4297g00005 [Zymoseptoria brevis]|uniref:Uncharacterized protein n=1 Tax=Zymoseptoria brevis TaxID=1047168 RepID=A0A0F4G851_9PEZI|nr:hypothetical protein TI39_contig4297g00005 [Zymoseptoria brevis]
MGLSSEPTVPDIPGVQDFEGEAFHTSRWPREWSVDGKRVGIIGTGATAIQIIPELVKLPLQDLTVFQRTANWSAPLRNEKISPAELAELRKQYPEIHKKCNESGAGFQYSLDRRKTFDVPEITNKGVLLANREEIELDILIYATGFDAITGPLARGIDIRGINGVSLSEKWEGDVETFLGLMVKDFPNMAMIMHQASDGWVHGGA